MSKKAKKQKTIGELLEVALVPEEEQPYEVPENWVWVELGHIAKFINGDRGKNYPSRKDLISEGIPFINAGHLIDQKIDIKNMNYISIEKYNSLGNGKVLINDILYCIRGSLGKTAIVNGVEKGAIASSLVILRANKNVNHILLYYYLISPLGRTMIKIYDNGSAQPNLSASNVKKYAFPLPPFNEQKRIADKVERLLNKIDEAKQLIDEAKETFTLRRAAILDQAFRGELTAGWREENQDIELAKQRYNLIKEERFSLVESKRELSDITTMFDEFNYDEHIDEKGWLYLKANMFCYNINCGGTPSKDISENGEVPFLKVYNIVDNNISFSYKPQFIPRSVHESKLKKSMLRSRDVIMNIVGPPLKKIAIIPDEYPEMNMNQAIIRFRPIKYVLPEYIYYCLQYDETLKDVINETRGVVGQSNISITQSRNLVMPIPSLEEQHEIVKRVKLLLEKEDTVYELINNNTNLNDLKQSILSKAFRGELGTNNPTDESVIELLKEVLEEQ